VYSGCDTAAGTDNGVNKLDKHLAELHHGHGTLFRQKSRHQEHKQIKPP